MPKARTRTLSTLLIVVGLCSTVGFQTGQIRATPQVERLLEAALRLDDQAKRLTSLAAAERRAIARKDVYGQAECAYYAGKASAELYRWPTAAQAFARAAKLYLSVQATKDAGTATHEQGVSVDAYGDKKRALTILDQALKLEAQAKDQPGQAATLLAVARIHDDLGDRQIALERALGAAAIYRSLGTPEEGIALNYVGRVYEELGMRKEAISQFEAAATIFERSGDRRGQAQSLTNLGLSRDNQGDRQAALECYARALPLWGQDEAGRASTLNNKGKALKELRQFDAALRAYSEAATLWTKLGNRPGQALAMNNVGRVLVEQGKPAEALTWYARALVLAREIGVRELEAIVLRNSGYAADKLGYLPLAVIYGKESVMRFQELRADLKSLPRAMQESYAQEASPAYRFLAEKLIQLGRLAEAELVIDLLKDHEYFTYARGGKSQDVNLTPREAEWRAKYSTLGGSLAAAATEYEALAKQARAGKLTPEAAARRASLAAKLADARDAFSTFLRTASSAFSTAAATDDRIADLKTANELAQIVRGFPVRTAAIYTLVTQDGVRTILTLPNVTTLKDTESSKIPFPELSAKIAKLRTALTTPEYDPIPLASELYDILIRPLEADLADANVDRLIISVDGPLRYLPFGSLYDSRTRTFLAQKFSLGLFTPANRVSLTRQPSGDPTTVGFGVSKPHDVGNVHFEGLAAVPAEMADLRRLTGAKTFADEAFTEESMKSALAAQPTLVHLATHFELRPGDPEKSFLLLGDGKPLAIAGFGSWMQGVLASVDLLVLSACNTATPVGDVDGNELESFSRAAQENGAGAVLATLWPVNDTSTSLLMGKFYELRKQVGTCEALRQAQVWLVELGSDELAKHGTRAGQTPKPPAKGDLPAYKPDPNHPYAHPYYWAPFVLTGNPN